MKRTTILRNAALAIGAGAVMSLAAAAPASAYYDHHGQWHDYDERAGVGFGFSVGGPAYGYYPAYPAYGYAPYYGYNYPYYSGPSVGVYYRR